MLRTLVIGNKQTFNQTVGYIEILEVTCVFPFLSNNVDLYRFAAFFYVTFNVTQINRRAKYAHRLESGF